MFLFAWFLCMYRLTKGKFINCQNPESLIFVSSIHKIFSKGYSFTLRGASKPYVISTIGRKKKKLKAQNNLKLLCGMCPFYYGSLWMWKIVVYDFKLELVNWSVWDRKLHLWIYHPQIRLWNPLFFCYSTEEHKQF